MSDFLELPPLLTLSEQAQMLHDIAHVGLAVAALWYPERAWADLDIARGSLVSQSSPIERLGYIIKILPGLAQSLEQIRHSPISHLLSETRRTAPAVRARRVSVSALMEAARAGHSREWLTETVSTLNIDTPENRAVLSFIDTLQRDAEAIAAIAGATGNTNVMEAARDAVMRAKRLQTLLEWNQVTPEPQAWTLPPTQRMQLHPAYAKVAEQMRAYRRSFAFDWQHPLFALPARDLWQLYETWCWFQTLRALISLGCVPTKSTDTPPFAVRHDRLTLSIAPGVMSGLKLTTATGNKPIALYYQREYLAGERSLSRTMQPDIAIETANGETYLLDAKLKAYATPGDEASDIDQMHAYRDAILSSQSERNVRRAWCLYVGQLDNIGRDFISYGAKDESIVGGLRLRPGDINGTARLDTLLRAWLSL